MAHRDSLSLAPVRRCLTIVRLTSDALQPITRQLSDERQSLLQTLIPCYERSQSLFSSYSLLCSCARSNSRSAWSEWLACDGQRGDLSLLAFLVAHGFQLLALLEAEGDVDRLLVFEVEHPEDRQFVVHGELGEVGVVVEQRPDAVANASGV